MRYYSTPRLFCDVLEEMRMSIKTLNFAPILSLVEELQIIGNRMEAGLEGQRTLQEITDDISEKKKEIKALDKKCKDMEEIK